MDESFNFHSGHTFQKYPYLPAWRNEIPRDLGTTNETASLNTYASHVPTSVRSPRFHDARELRAQSQSRSQPRSSPTISDISPCSPPKRQKTIVSASSATTSSFPLPYKPPSAGHLTSSEPARPTVSLTSQDIHSNQPITLQSDRGRVLHGSGGDTRTVSATFRNNGLSEPTGHVLTPDQTNWQYPRAQPQERLSRVSGYGAPRASLYSQYSPWSDLSCHSSMEFTFPPERKWQSHYDTHSSRQNPFFAAEAQLQRSNQSHLSQSFNGCNPLDFSNRFDNAPTCGFKYHSALDSDDLIRPIRETTYWPEMKGDPIFSDLSVEGPTIPIAELISRRKLALSDHVLLPRPAMNEKGTQTDFVEAPSPAISTRSSDRDIGSTLSRARSLEIAPQNSQDEDAAVPHSTTTTSTTTSSTTPRPNFRTAHTYPLRRRPNGTANRKRIGRNHFSEPSSVDQSRHRVRSLKRLRPGTEDYEDTVDRQEAKINGNLRHRDNSVYSRRW